MDFTTTPPTHDGDRLLSPQERLQWLHRAVDLKIAEVLSRPAVSRRPAFISYLQKNYLSRDYRVKWMFAYRCDNPYLRGHNTSNVAEANFRVEKYEVMSRVKSLSPVHHVRFLLGRFEEYMARRVLESTTGRFSLIDWFKKIFKSKEYSASSFSKLKVEDELYGEHRLVVVHDHRSSLNNCTVTVDLQRWRCYGCPDSDFNSSGCLHRLAAQSRFPHSASSEAPPNASPITRLFYSWIALGPEEVITSLRSVGRGSFQWIHCCGRSLPVDPP